MRRTKELINGKFHKQKNKHTKHTRAHTLRPSHVNMQKTRIMNSLCRLVEPIHGKGSGQFNYAETWG